MFRLRIIVGFMLQQFDTGIVGLELVSTIILVLEANRRSIL